MEKILSKEKIIELINKTGKQHIDVYTESEDERIPLKLFKSWHNGMTKVWVMKDLKRVAIRSRDLPDMHIKTKISAKLGKGCNPPRNMRNDMLEWRLGFVDIFMGLVEDEIKRNT